MFDKGECFIGQPNVEYQCATADHTICVHDTLTVFPTQRKSLAAPCAAPAHEDPRAADWGKEAKASCPELSSQQNCKEKALGTKHVYHAVILQSIKKKRLLVREARGSMWATAVPGTL